MIKRFLVGLVLLPFLPVLAVLVEVAYPFKAECPSSADSGN